MPNSGMNFINVHILHSFEFGVEKSLLRQFIPSQYDLSSTLDTSSNYNYE